MAPVARSSAASAAVKAGDGDRTRHMEWAGVLHKHVKVKKDTGRFARLCDALFYVSYDHLKNVSLPRTEVDEGVQLNPPPCPAPPHPPQSLPFPRPSPFALDAQPVQYAGRVHQI